MESTAQVRLDGQTPVGAPTDAGGFEGNPISELIRDGRPGLAVQRVYGIVGTDVRGSPSPRLHNAAYHALGMSALYLPFSVAQFHDFWERIAEGQALPGLGMPLHGLSVNAPYKE